eukprot:scaffold303791_cov102-Attheya_sp.AAC.1
MRLIRKQLCPLQSGSCVPDLTGYSLLADRLYWSLEFEQDFVLASGMDIEAATHKRDQNFGFTYDQYKAPTDIRRHIPLAGHKALFLRCKNVHGRHLNGFAYRNNGNVTLGTSTKHFDMHWDLVLKNPLDRKNHTLLNWRDKAWRPSIEPHDAIHDPLFASL